MYETCDAIAKVVGGDVEAHARALGLGTKSIYKWMERARRDDEPVTHNPLERVIILSKTARNLGRTNEQVLAPLQCYAQSVQHATVGIPVTMRTPKAMAGEFARITAELGGLASIMSDTIDRGLVSPVTAYKIKQKCWLLIQSVVAFEKAIQAASAPRWS